MEWRKNTTTEWDYINSYTLGVGVVEFGRFVVISIVRRPPSPRKF